jgi:hypothetical protein
MFKMVMLRHGSCEVHYQLLKHGFTEGSTRWTSHREEVVAVDGEGGDDDDG